MPDRGALHGLAGAIVGVEQALRELGAGDATRELRSVLASERSRRRWTVRELARIEMTTTGHAVNVSVIVAGGGAALCFAFAFGELGGAFHGVLTLIARELNLQ